MKRTSCFIVVLILFYFISLISVQADVLPTYTSTVPKNVYGFLQTDKFFDVHEKPSEQSPLADSVSWDNAQVIYKKNHSDPTDSFAVFIPKKKIYFWYVLDEEDGWYKVLYDKKNLKSGWVKSGSENFWNLKDFYTYYGKKNSLYYLRDVDVRTRTLRSGPSETSQALQGFSVTKNIKLVIIRGNWALVSIIDYEGTVPKTGFIKWRGSDGSLYLFPMIK